MMLVKQMTGSEHPKCFAFISSLELSSQDCKGDEREQETKMRVF